MKRCSMKSPILILFLNLFINCLALTMGFSQPVLQKKQANAGFITSLPKIDGILDDAAWQSIPELDQFVQYAPRNGALPAFDTKVKIAYDNKALYIAAFMYDNHPDSILKEFGPRDEVENLNADLISFDFCPYQDGINTYEFKISASGIQQDVKYSAQEQNFQWNAVWESAVSINDSGWVAEVRIPFSAIRFPKSTEQHWNFNIWRQIRRYREWSTWSFIDINSENIFTQYATLSGIKNIQPPLRLSFYPYISGYLEQYPGDKNWSYKANGGMDVKYGINESFTLDMTLIPDFGQVQSDDKVLNLTPYEIMYNENRQFFTEGTELFNKCDIFYSRRIGERSRYINLSDNGLDSNEIITNEPDKTKLINATKFSGRTRKGLGIGVFNAMTSNAFADVLDTVSNAKRQQTTQPFTNYNILVLDQNFAGNSYLSLINTNTAMDQASYAANVTGTEYKLVNKKNTYQAEGTIIASQRYHKQQLPEFGHANSLELSKIKGKLIYSISREEKSDVFDINDMGYLEKNNYVEYKGEITYRMRIPKGKILNWTNKSEFKYQHVYVPAKEIGYTLVNKTDLTFNNFLTVHLNIITTPAGIYNYDEPRVAGQFYKVPAYIQFDGWISPDYRKPFVVDFNYGYGIFNEDTRYYYWLGFSPRIRFSDRMMLILSNRNNFNFNNIGYVAQLSDTTGNSIILFGRRDVNTITNVINLRYIFSDKLALSLRMRHYLSWVKYAAYFALNRQGKLDPSDNKTVYDENFNLVNSDLLLTWRFAPGSELTLSWKNEISEYISGAVRQNYWDNFNNTLQQLQGNSISLKLLYYVDYLNLKRKR